MQLKAVTESSLSLTSKAMHNHSHDPNRYAVVPLPERLGANGRLRGRGVRIAFLDSGFYPHPDLENRVVRFHDVTEAEADLGEIRTPQSHHWHGTQTSVVCAGDGKLSNGIYRGLASRAELVLIKVGSENGRVTEDNIERGLEWVLENRETYDIRVLNISIGADLDLGLSESRIDWLAEECVKEGIVVVAAAGNSGLSESPHSIPPANAPAVITVGGYGDGNQLDEQMFELYHSNYGATKEGNVKPEIIAPAMSIAAPILPGTSEYLAAEMLEWISTTPDYKLGNILFEHWHQADLPERIMYQSNKEAQREMIETEFNKRKIVATHYQHVDGTSFAAPIVSSIVAQMLEANPNLSPRAVKNILISTAERLRHFPAVRQGFGVVNAPRSVKQAVKETHRFVDCEFSPPRVERETIVFIYHDDAAREVWLAGEFNDWQLAKTRFQKQSDGFWRAEIEIPPPGKYRYKFVADKLRWTEDASNGLREADGYGGFNSILYVS